MRKILKEKEARRAQPHQQKMGCDIRYGKEERLPEDPAPRLMPEDKPKQPQERRRRGRHQQIVCQRQAGQYLHAAVQRLSPEELLGAFIAVDQPQDR